MRNTLLILFTMLVFQTTILAQSDETRNYEWSDKPAIQTLSTEEAKEPAVVIFEKKIVEYSYNKNDQLELHITRHKLVHLNEDKAVEESNEIYIPVSNPDQLVNFKARSISPSGAIRESLKGEMKVITEDGQRYMSLAIDGLSKGSELEYYYTLSAGSTFYGSEMVQSGNYIRSGEITIISPENIVLQVKAYNGYPQLTDTIVDGRRKYSAKSEKIKPMQNEEYSFRESNMMRVEYKVAQNIKKTDNYLLTFADGGNLFYSRLTEFEKDEEKEVQKLVSKLGLASKPDEEKARAIETYIKSNINVQDGSRVAYLVEVIKNGIASSFGVQRLAVAMTKKAGLRFEIIVTTSRYDKKFDPKFESWNFLNEVLLYYPTIDKYMLPENAAYRLGIVPLQFAGNSGLFIKEMELGGSTSGVSMVQDIPVPGPEKSHHDMEVSITFDNTVSKVTQHAKHIHSGYTTLNYRPAYFYIPEEKKTEFLEDILKSSIEGAKVSNIKTQNSNLNSAEAEKDFIVEGDVTYSSLIEKADNSFLFKVGAVIGPQTELYQEKPRQNTIDIVYPHVLDREITITIPNGYVAKGLDALAINITGGDPKAPTMGFVSEYKLEGDKLKIKVHEYYNEQEYNVSQYEEFRKVINAAADFNKITILFEKK